MSTDKMAVLTAKVKNYVKIWLLLLYSSTV